MTTKSNEERVDYQEEEENNLDDHRSPEVIQDEENAPFWSRNRYVMKKLGL